MKSAILLTVFACLAGLPSVQGHGAMVFPSPRSAHNQVLDDRNKCGCEDTPGGCYSSAGSEGEYCGLGCIGEACLYYAIGCYQNCPTCSYVGKTLYPVPGDLVKAGNCPTPPAPTLGGGDPAKEHALRTNNIDNLSKLGDWTRWNPWRSPGTAGKGNPAFQPCGVNSGSNPTFPNPPAKGQAQFANGTDLPATPKAQQATWKRGSTVDATWSIYANHGGGYQYRICKRKAGQAETEECYQRTPLKFATDTTKIHYPDGSRADFFINATTTDEGTWPVGSQWRKNPIPMCNCDLGMICDKPKSDDGRHKAKAAPALERAVLEAARAAKVGELDFLATQGGGDGGAKHCVPVSDEAQCGKTMGKNTCLKCGHKSDYNCLECCPGLIMKNMSYGGALYSYCVEPNQPTAKCDPASGDTRPCYFEPYAQTYVPEGKPMPARCQSGLAFPAQWDDGHSGFVGGPGYTMTDKLEVPSDIPAGDYSLSWRWDCEETPQVWNSCADIQVV